MANPEKRKNDVFDRAGTIGNLTDAAGIGAGTAAMIEAGAVTLGPAAAVGWGTFGILGGNRFMGDRARKSWNWLKERPAKMVERMESAVFRFGSKSKPKTLYQAA